jgi:endo-1,4-beta-xylanase
LIIAVIGIFWKITQDSQSLRRLAERRELVIGSAISGRQLRNQNYSSLLTREFNSITPENAMKFGPLSPAPGQYDFTEADLIVAFAEEHGMQVRGHTLVWTNQLPEWLTTNDYTQNEILELLHTHIQTVVERYRGKVLYWDVVNEALANDGSIATNNFWMEHLGPDYITLAFQWAHEADPNAMLFYNESYAEGKGQKADGVFTLVQNLLAQGVPIHGIGMEMHTGLGWSPKPEELAENMRKIAGLGLMVHITEMDVRIEEPVTVDELDQQAQIYAEILQTCLEATNCSGFTMWGLTDAVSWIPYIYPGTGTALIFDANYQPKPAYDAMIKVLQGR